VPVNDKLTHLGQHFVDLRPGSGVMSMAKKSKKDKKDTKKKGKKGKK
jgi:hypothetical protein